MRAVLLLRHGKSDWGADYETDHERPLAKRGRKAAARMGILLAALDLVPRRVITSTAVRARTTVELAAAAGGWRAPVEETRELYGAEPDAVLQMIQGLDDTYDRVLLTGHEPTWSLLAGGLLGAAGVRFPTAGLLHVRFDADAWQQVDYGKGELVWFVTPKLLSAVPAPE